MFFSLYFCMNAQCQNTRFRKKWILNIMQLHTERNNKSRQAFDETKLRKLKLQHVKYGIKLWLNGALVVEMKSNIKIIIRIRRNVHIQCYVHLRYFSQKIGDEKENILRKKKSHHRNFLKGFSSIEMWFSCVVLKLKFENIMLIKEI